MNIISIMNRVRLVGLILFSLSLILPQALIVTEAQAAVVSYSNIVYATPSSIWHPPPQVTKPGYLGRPQENGWWPSLSPDGRYVSYGNGEVWISDLRTNQTYNFSDPPGSSATYHRCWGGSLIGMWI